MNRTLTAHMVTIDRNDPSVPLPLYYQFRSFCFLSLFPGRAPGLTYEMGLPHSLSRLLLVVPRLMGSPAWMGFVFCITASPHRTGGCQTVFKRHNLEPLPSGSSSDREPFAPNTLYHVTDHDTWCGAALDK